MLLIMSNYPLAYLLVCFWFDMSHVLIVLSRGKPVIILGWEEGEGSRQSAPVDVNFVRRRILESVNIRKW